VNKFQKAAEEITDYGKRLLVDENNKYRGGVHINTYLGVAQYVRIARELETALPAGGRVLDWGAGWGHNTYLLKTAGLDVKAFDVRPIYQPFWPKLFGDSAMPELTICEPEDDLPYADGEFDAVLNCGVLEHVGDEEKALAELHRVLKPGGLLFTFYLPNYYSWTERAGRMAGRVVHENLYRKKEVINLFEQSGFSIQQINRMHCLPRNLLSKFGFTGNSKNSLDFYLWLDSSLSALWPINIFSTTWKVISTRD
jgi:cyclopropane fatty-acyl-phospholipid synthase-like methyltransferase